MRSAISSAILCATFAAIPADRSIANPNDWSGFYAGGHIGYSWGETGNSWRNLLVPWSPDGDISYSSTSGGVHVGHLWQYGWLAFGVEGDITWASLRGDDSQVATILNELEVDYVSTIRGRLGVTHGASFIYATAGVALGEVDKRDITRGTAASDDVVGWTIGAGYEHALGGGWRGRVEYQYIDFGSVVAPLNGYDHRADDLDIQSVSGGVSYGF